MTPSAVRAIDPLQGGGQRIESDRRLTVREDDRRVRIRRRDHAQSAPQRFDHGLLQPVRTGAAVALRSKRAGEGDRVV